VANVTVDEMCKIDPKYTIAGFQLQQTWSALFLLNQILVDNPDITRVVELGTYAGGLSVFFGLIMKNRGGRVIALDIVEPRNPYALEIFNVLNTTFYKQDISGSEGIETVKQFISDGRALIFNDGGDKKGTLPVYAKLAKTDDLIMSHDWMAEIFPKDLNDEILSTLELYRHEDFKALRARILSMKKCADRSEERRKRNRKLLHLG